MKIKNIAILTSKDSWFFPYAENFVSILQKRGYLCKLFWDHETLNKSFDAVFILSYFRIIDEEFLKRNRFNLVVHESNLPKGKGWSPLFWQILKNKNVIPIVLFEAKKNIDSGNIYISDVIKLKGDELHDEIRQAQADKMVELCTMFIDSYQEIIPKRQIGKQSFFRKRIPEDSELNINKSIKDQFNLLRIVNNEEYPAFFYLSNKKYILKIFRG